VNRGAAFMAGVTTAIATALGAVWVLRHRGELKKQAKRIKRKAGL
jgi:hypothetical protein